jgi:ABC-2 type transport system ATP-binding protein
MTAAIMLTGVRKTYADFALQDIDLELRAGQIMGLVGVNGAGKSTLFRILTGLIQPDDGQVAVCGHRLPHEQVAAKREIGYASDDMRLYKAKTLRWHMDLIRAAYPGWDETYASQLLERFDLRPNQPLGGFSHGQRVKALLLLSLARHPRLLLLDEPTTGLDPLAHDEVLQAIADVLRDEARSVLFSSHNTRDVEQLSDSIAFLHRGRLVAVEDKETFLDRWRRVLCRGEWRDDIATLPEVAAVRRNGSVIELKVKAFSDALLPQLRQLGLTVNDVNPMDLEDIFVTSIRPQGAHGVV